MDDTDAPTQQEGERSNRKAALKYIITITVSLLFFSLVSPTAVPLVMLIVGFVMLGALFYAIWQLLLLASGLTPKLTTVQRRVIIVLGVFLPLLLIMLQSLGQLTVRDVLTLSGVFVVGAFYILQLNRQGRR